MDTQPAAQPAQIRNVWLVIEITPSILDLDRTMGVKVDEAGNMQYIPDEKRWRSLVPTDVPEWLKTDQAIQDMVNGQRLCSDVNGGGHWYRAILCSPAASTAVN